MSQDCHVKTGTMQHQRHAACQCHTIQSALGNQIPLIFFFPILVRSYDLIIVKRETSLLIRRYNRHPTAHSGLFNISLFLNIVHAPTDRMPQFLITIRVMKKAH